MPKRTEGKRLTKAQWEVLREAHNAMGDGGIWFLRSSLVVAMRLRERGLLRCKKRHPKLKMFLFTITAKGRTALKTGASE